MKLRRITGLRSSLVFSWSIIGMVLSGAYLTVGATQVLTKADAGALRTAVQNGGAIALNFDGIVSLSRLLRVGTNATLDATGHHVSIDGGNVTRHFLVSSGITLRLVNLTLMNGRYSGAAGGENQDGSPAWGGSIYNSGGRVEVLNCAFLSNQAAGGKGGPFPSPPPVGTGTVTVAGAAYGGGIYSVGGSLWLTNCSFLGNAANGGQGTSGEPIGVSVSTGAGGSAYGGAIYCTNSTLSCVDCSFTNNLAQAGDLSFGRLYLGGGLAYGGAVYETGPAAALSGCIFNGNRALAATKTTAPPGYLGTAFGGAVFHESGDLGIDRTLFLSNSVVGGASGGAGTQLETAGEGDGGALYRSGGTVHVQSSAFISNQANGGSAFSEWLVEGGLAQGGAIYSAFGSETNLLIVNCTLAQNSAVGGIGLGGALGGTAQGGAVYGSATLVNVTIATNSVKVGPNVSIYYPFLSPRGSAITMDPGEHAVLRNSILACAAGETNVFGPIIDGGHNISSDSSAGFYLPTSRNGVDPLLGPLAYNGGPTPTMALLPASPAIDAGDDSACPSTDQRGVVRPQGLGCDSGAFELAPTFMVSKGPGGLVTLEYQFQANRTYTITASPDLRNWSSVETRAANGNGELQFDDPSSVQAPYRFYQIQPQKGQ